MLSIQAAHDIVTGGGVGGGDQTENITHCRCGQEGEGRCYVMVNAVYQNSFALIRVPG